jgi:hypothetical protein
VCIYEYTYAYIYINIIIIYNIQYSDMLSTQQHDYQSCLCHTHARPSTLPLSHASLSPSTLRVARQPEPAPPPTQAPPVLEQRDRRLAPPRRHGELPQRAIPSASPAASQLPCILCRLLPLLLRPRRASTQRRKHTSHEPDAMDAVENTHGVLMVCHGVVENTHGVPWCGESGRC